LPQEESPIDLRKWPDRGCSILITYPQTEAQANRLIVAAFPDLRITSLRLFGEGWSNLTWLASTQTERILFRFPKTTQAETNIRKEMQLLPELTTTLPLPGPDYRYTAPCGALDHTYAFGGYPLIPGEPLAKVDWDAPPTLSTAVGDWISALHRFPVERAATLSVPGGTPDVWRHRYQTFYTEIRDLLSPYLDIADIAIIDRRFDAFLGETRFFRFDPVLLHGDLSADHLLVDSVTKGLTGVIDFEDAIIGDPAFDFTATIALGQAVLQAYQGQRDDTFFERVDFYRWLIPVHRMRYGVQSNLPAQIAAGLSSLRVAR
jgi:aminoglycoside 2''-phosphotransferase